MFLNDSAALQVLYVCLINDLPEFFYYILNAGAGDACYFEVCDLTHGLALELPLQEGRVKITGFVGDDRRSHDQRPNYQ